MPAKKKLGAVGKPKKVKKVALYSVEVSVNGKTSKFETDSVLEALKSFVAPDAIKTETLIRVTKDGKTLEKEVSVSDARRAFGGSNVSLELLAINLVKLLG